MHKNNLYITNGINNTNIVNVNITNIFYLTLFLYPLSKKGKLKNGDVVVWLWWKCNKHPLKAKNGTIFESPANLVIKY